MSNGRISAWKAQMVGFIHAVQYLRVPLWLRSALLFLTNCSSVELSLRQQDRNCTSTPIKFCFIFTKQA
ncbi:hypothetical protein M758_6G166100 [Ceratodon purpureus]|nr:hypothetical protein M758_6G166100 [Ceratodon purpureus]